EQVRYQHRNSDRRRRFHCDLDRVIDSPGRLLLADDRSEHAAHICFLTAEVGRETLELGCGLLRAGGNATGPLGYCSIDQDDPQKIVRAIFCNVRGNILYRLRPAYQDRTIDVLCDEKRMKVSRALLGGIPGCGLARPTLRTRIERNDALLFIKPSDLVAPD